MSAAHRRILFVMHMAPPVHGVSVMNELIRRSEVINGAFACDYVNLTTARSIEDLQKARFSKYLKGIAILARVFFKLLTRRFDIAYVTVFPYGFAFYKDSMVVLLAKLFGVKCVVHLHTYGFRKGADGSSTRLKYYQLVFRNTHPICLSKRLVEDIETVFKGEVTILPNGIPVENSENTYTGDGPVKILFLSNLIRSKGILHLIDAAELMAKEGTAFTLRIVGAESELDYSTLSRIIAAKDLTANVEIAGARFGPDKIEEYRAASIFVLPTDFDTFGLVLLEAMQFGVPCVSTGIGAIPDLLGDGNGVIIESIAPRHIADALSDLIRDSEKRKRISLSAFRHFHSNFTSHHFEQRLAAILMGKSEGSHAPVADTVLVS